jgi:hypothetical protein
VRASVVTARGAAANRTEDADFTDTQPVLLSAASRWEDGAIVLVPNLKGSAASKVGGKLLRGGLSEEVPAVARSRRGAMTMTPDHARSA